MHRIKCTKERERRKRTLEWIAHIIEVFWVSNSLQSASYTTLLFFRAPEEKRFPPLLRRLPYTSNWGGLSRIDYESLAAASKKRGAEFLAFLPRTSHVYMYLVVFILSVLFQLYVSFRVGKEHSRPRSKITRPIYHLLIMCSNIISRLFGVSALLRRGHYGPPNFLRRANETREIGDSEWRKHSAPPAHLRPQRQCVLSQETRPKY